MDSTSDPTGAPSGQAQPQQQHMLISADNQQLVLSAEDAAQLLAQAGLQLGDNERVIIGDIGGAQGGVQTMEEVLKQDVGSEVSASREILLN